MIVSASIQQKNVSNNTSQNLTRQAKQGKDATASIAMDVR